MTDVRIECVHVSPGVALNTGARLLDLSVDLGSVFSQDCPPISYYRIVLREPAWLRRLFVAPGEMCALGGLIGLFSSTPDEPIDGPIQRGVRVATAGILYHSGMWSDGDA